VHDVLAHLLMPLEVGVPRFLVAMLLAGGNYDRANERLTARLARREFGEMVEVLRRRAHVRFTPPGSGPEARLTDVLVHGLDVRRPLDLPRVVPAERTRKALGFLMGSPSGLVPRGMLDGLRFVASDVDWSHGEGPEVIGTADELLLVCTGRTAAPGSLTGDGVSTVRGRRPSP
jgi:uncharacterized protein (TIGR03083 family)